MIKLNDFWKVSGNTEAGFADALSAIATHTTTVTDSPLPYYVKDGIAYECKEDPFDEKVRGHNISELLVCHDPELMEEAKNTRAVFSCDGRVLPVTRFLRDQFSFIGLTKQENFTYHQLGMIREKTKNVPIRMVVRTDGTDEKIFSCHSKGYAYCPQNVVGDFVMNDVLSPAAGARLDSWSVTHFGTTATFLFEGQCEERSYGIYDDLVFTPQIVFNNSDSGDSSLRMTLSWNAECGFSQFLATGKDTVLAKHTGSMSRIKKQFLSDANRLLGKLTTFPRRLDELHSHVIPADDVIPTLDALIEDASIKKIGQTLTNCMRDYCVEVLDDGKAHSEAEIVLTVMAAPEKAKSTGGLDLKEIMSDNQINWLGCLMAEVPYRTQSSKH